MAQLFRSTRSVFLLSAFTLATTCSTAGQTRADETVETTEPKTENPDDKLGGSGESCTKTADCKTSMKCVSNVCIDPKLGVQGDSCTKSNDCNYHLGCIDKKCASRLKTASSIPAPSTTAPTPNGSADGTPMTRDEIDETAKRSAGSSVGGFEGTLAFGYGLGLGTSADGLNSPAFQTDIAYRFVRNFGIAGSVAITGKPLGEMALGIHVGRLVFFRLLVGSVSHGNTGELGVIGQFGGHIHVSDYFALTPILTVGRAISTDNQDGAFVLLGFGLSFRMQKPNELPPRKAPPLVDETPTSEP